MRDSEVNLQCKVEAFPLNGFIGPFNSQLPTDVFHRFREKMLEYDRKGYDHPLYGRYSARDWHLVDDDALAIIKQEDVVSKLKRYLGSDLVVWRSKVFHKRPGESAIEWHQEWGQFNGEEIGNDIPSLLPAPSQAETGRFWNLTIWFALQDVSFDMGPLQFVNGSHKTRYPIDMVPIPECAFWQNPMDHMYDKNELIEKCRNSKLVLDVDSSKFLQDVQCDCLELNMLKKIIYEKFCEKRGAVTLPFDLSGKVITTVPVLCGQYVIFPERTMHRSLENFSNVDRLGINFRVTTGSTLIYPCRSEDFIDGSNLNVSRHKNVLLCGDAIEKRNVFV